MKLRVEKLVDGVDPSAEENDDGDHEGDVERSNGSRRSQLVAVDVIAALCECPAGITGGCSHATMLLFLARLLTLTDAELSSFNPSTCTGRACAWIEQHCNARRSASKCPLYGMPLSECTSIIRGLRDPFGRVGMDDDPLAQTRGVTGLDRMNGFNPHPSGGAWAEQRHDFSAGIDISMGRWNLFLAYVECETGSQDHDVASAVLPPRVRASRDP